MVQIHVGAQILAEATSACSCSSLLLRGVDALKSFNHSRNPCAKKGVTNTLVSHCSPNDAAGECSTVAVQSEPDEDGSGQGAWTIAICHSVHFEESWRANTQGLLHNCSQTADIGQRSKQPRFQLLTFQKAAICSTFQVQTRTNIFTKNE